MALIGNNARALDMTPRPSPMPAPQSPATGLNGTLLPTPTPFPIPDQQPFAGGALLPSPAPVPPPSGLPFEPPELQNSTLGVPQPYPVIQQMQPHPWLPTPQSGTGLLSANVASPASGGLFGMRDRGAF